MRLSLPAIALSVCVCPFGPAAAGTSGDVAKAPAPKTATAPAMQPSATPDASDAAARHAKRTACIKQARTKKLVGAEKNSFIKDCIAGR
ncbi:MAG TPA: hypothetical protein VKP66_18750 [Steroidobacteraceae bacterium]|nr:hypothetical protein [Steroidobacteraceae bacterium]